MKKIKKQTIENLFSNQTEIVTWEDSYITGIELVDLQHKELVDITNQLFQACLSGNDKVAIVFKDTMAHMVEYVRYHFAVEQELMKRINYPNYYSHKMQHDHFVKEIISAAAEYNDGKKFAPNLFVRTLKDWVFSHIAYYDKSYAHYVNELRLKGFLPDQCIECRLSHAVDQ